MSNFATALKDEIRRLARKEIKAQTASTNKAVAQYRREITNLKRQVREQEKLIAALSGKAVTRKTNGVVRKDLDLGEEGQRFSAKSVKSQRRRAGLSAADYAKLVGVTPLTIYNWENGKSRPRKEQFAALTAIRGMGKREARARLAEITGEPPTSRPRRKRTEA